MTKTLEEQRLEAMINGMEEMHGETAEERDISIDGEILEYSGMRYLVSTEEEVLEEVKDYITESLCYFNASFLASYTDVTETVIEAIQSAPEEEANQAIYSLIGDFDDFVAGAIYADGAGHFLSSYDGEGYEVSVEDEYFTLFRVG